MASDDRGSPVGHARAREREGERERERERGREGEREGERERGREGVREGDAERERERADRRRVRVRSSGIRVVLITFQKDVGLPSII